MQIVIDSNIHVHYVRVRIFFKLLEIVEDFLKPFFYKGSSLCMAASVRACHFILREICETIEYSRIFF